MKKRKHLREHLDSSFSLTPMIDVTFLLLVFFLCTLKFRQLDGKLSSYLPPDAGRGPRKDVTVEELSIALFVVDPGLRVDRLTGRPLELHEERPFDLLGRRVGYRFVGRDLPDLDALVDDLERIPRDPAPPLVVHVGLGVVYGEVIALLDSLVGLGLTEVRLAAD